jgi:tubulin-specific chaperone A
MAPSQIQIAISSLQRLLKEEQSYYKEQSQQEARISKLENSANGSDENHEYSLRQEVGSQPRSKSMKRCENPCANRCPKFA